MVTPDNVHRMPGRLRLVPPPACEKCGGKGEMERRDLINVGGKTYWTAPRNVPCPAPGCGDPEESA